MTGGEDRQGATYQLLIFVDGPVSVRVGRLGTFVFPAGHYVYTGSARRGMAARLRRHLSRDKRMRWHIDYLLSDPRATVVDVHLFRAQECRVNQRTGGVVPVPGFGASDCRAGCGSHLRYLGTGRPGDGRPGVGQTLPAFPSPFLSRGVRPGDRR